MATRIQIRRDTQANWSAINPVLLLGELGLVVDTGLIKTGDGVSAWNALAYSKSDWNQIQNKPDPIITLAGDLSGSVTLTDLGNGTLTATVADDSHNHIIANVDGLQTALDLKANIASPTFTGTVGGITKAMVGLSNVDNTADTAKPVSTAQATAIGLKVTANSNITAGTATKVTYDAKGLVTSGTTLSASDIPSLDASKITSGTIDAARLPSYVDDVIEGTNLAAFPVTGETGKIYVALDTNKTYRWSGTAYVYITSGAVDSVAGKTGVVTLVKGDVGLGNVDNTSDANKPVSTAQATAIGLKADSTTVSSHTSNTSNPHSVTKAQVGLGNVDNTADTAKPVSTAQQTALDLKANLASPTFTGTVSGITKAMVGLGNVDNTSDALKPVSTAQATAIAGKQPLDADLTAIAGLAGTTGLLKKTAADTWTLDTSAYVTSSGVTSVTGTAPIASSGGATPSISITAATTSAAGSMSSADKTKLDGIASGANNYVHPSGDGNLHVPATSTTNNGKVLTAGATAGSLSWTTIPSAPVSSVAGKTGVVTLVKGDVGLGSVDNTSDTAKPVSTAQQTALDLKANLASPTFTGTVTAPTFSGALSGNATSATTLQTARTINGVSFNGSANITINAVDSTARIASSEKGAVNGVATLDASGKVPAAQLPSYVDDVIEATTLPATGETGKIYVKTDDNTVWRWTGSAYVEISVGTGTADSAVKLATARTIALSGDVTGSVSFDGSANATITATVVDDSHDHIIANVDGLQAALDGKVDDSQVLTNVPAGAVFTDTVYTLPTATSTIKGGVELFSDTVQSIASNAVSATASRTYGIQLNSEGQAVVNVPWVDTNTTYAVATTSANGLMSSTDKTKLDGVAAGANNYVLPIASTTVLGGVKAGTNITIDASGVISSAASGGGGATGGGSDSIFMLNGTTVTTNYSIPVGQNAGTFGPISIATGVVVTIPTGSTWTIV